MSIPRSAITSTALGLILAAGSGFGDPSARAPSALAHDLAMGWVTPAGAARDYPGVAPAHLAADAAQAEPAGTS